MTLSKLPSLQGVEGGVQPASAFGPPPWPPGPLTSPRTAGRHLHVCPYSTAGRKPPQWLGWSKRLSPIIQNPRLWVQGDSEVSVPRGLGLGVTWWNTSTRWWAHCPGAPLNQEGPSPQHAPSPDRSRLAAITKSLAFSQDLPPTTLHPPEGRNKRSVG